MVLRSPDELTRMRRMLQRELGRRGLAGADVAAIVLATHEAAKNGLGFSDPERSPVEVAVVFGVDGEVCVHVTDAGQGFEPAVASCAPPLDEDHGRGLCLMRGLMDSVRVERRGSLTVVCLRKRLSAGRLPDGGRRHAA